jgi:hypothetical protein
VCALGWAGWLAAHVTGSDEAEEAPLADSGLPGLLKTEGELLSAPGPAPSVAESLMQTFEQAYCGEVAGLPFDPPVVRPCAVWVACNEQWAGVARAPCHAA